MRLLFLADVFGSAGRRAVEERLPGLRGELGVDFCVVNGEKYGSVIDIQPVGEPSVVLSVSHVQADPALTVGSTITASTSRLGRVVDLSGAERLALARYTRDAGNYVELTLHPAGSVPLR